MRRSLFIILVACIGLGVARLPFVIGSHFTPYGYPSQTFSSLEEMIAATPTVITGRVVDNSEEFTYGSVAFVKTPLRIKDVFRDSNGLTPGDVITLLQTAMEEDPVVSQDDELLLFLVKYEGPVIDDGYRIVGLKQGHFTIMDGKIHPKKKGERSFPIISISELKRLLNGTAYVPPEVLTREELQKFEQERQQRRLDMLRITDKETANPCGLTHVD